MGDFEIGESVTCVDRPGRVIARRKGWRKVVFLDGTERWAPVIILEQRKAAPLEELAWEADDEKPQQ